MASTDVVRRSIGGGGESALRDFLSHSVIYEKAGAVMPRDLVQFGFFGSGIVILAGLIALALPDPAAIRSAGGVFHHSHLFLLLGPLAAGLDGFMQSLAVPAIVCGVLLLGLDVYLTQVPTSERWRWAVVGQAAAGGVGAGVGVLFLALLILNVMVWVVIVVFIAVACLMVLAMLLGAMGGG